MAIDVKQIFEALNEGFLNFLPADIEKKTKHAAEVHAMRTKSYPHQNFDGYSG
jgi:hypothetical protein